MKILLLVFLSVSLSLVSYSSPKKVKVVFLGDSLTAGYGIDVNKSYPALLAEKWKKDFPQVEVLNSSISGSTTAGSSGRLKWLMKSPIQVLVVALGANDGLRGFDLAVTRKNLEELIRLAQANNIKVVLAGMQMPLNYGKKYREDFQNLYVDLEKKFGLTRIPFLLEGVGGESAMNIADGIHPNEKGHIKMAQTVGPIVEKLFSEKGVQ